MNPRSRTLAAISTFPNLKEAPRSMAVPKLEAKTTRLEELYDDLRL